jgi:hypothetical protein
MHRPFPDQALANGNQLTADLRMTTKDGYFVTTTYRAGRLRGWLIPYVDRQARPRLGLRVKVDRLNERCVEVSVPRGRMWTQRELAFDTNLGSFHNGISDTTLLPTR